MDTPSEPKKRGRKPGTPKTPGSGRVKGRPPRIPEDIRAVCREVLGLENLAIRKRMKRWFESGDGLGSTTFRHVLQMGYGLPKHAMASGEQLRDQLVFASTTGYVPWDPANPLSKEMNERSARMIAEGDARLALEAAERKAEVIEAKATTEDDVETLQSVVPPPEPPETFGGGGRGR